MRFWKKQLRIGVRQLACICQPAAWELQNIFLLQTFRRIFQLRCCLNIFIYVCTSNWINETFHSDMRIEINVLVPDSNKIKFWQLSMINKMFAKFESMTYNMWQLIDTCLIHRPNVILNLPSFAKYYDDVFVNDHNICIYLTVAWILLIMFIETPNL